MNMSRKLLLGTALSGLLLSGCVSKVTEQSQYSGFLPNYDGLQEVTTPSGQKAMRWIAPGFQPSAYDTVVFKQLDLYPAPKPTERVNLQTLQELQSYTSTAVKSALAQNYQVVSSTQSAANGARVLILRAAIYSPDGAEKVDGTVTLSPGDRDAPARLAADLLARASPAITALFTGPE